MKVAAGSAATKKIKKFNHKERKDHVDRRSIEEAKELAAKNAKLTKVGDCG